jgi:hypothetical protein
MNVALEQVTTSLISKLRVNPSMLNSAVTIVKVGVEIVQGLPNAGSAEERKLLLIRALEKVAAGADGVQGTSDDLIPATIMNHLKVLLETKMAMDMIGVLQVVDFKAINAKCKCLPF